MLKIVIALAALICIESGTVYVLIKMNSSKKKTIKALEEKIKTTKAIHESFTNTEKEVKEDKKVLNNVSNATNAIDASLDLLRKWKTTSD